MAKYSSLVDITDQSIVVTDEDLYEADNYIDNMLKMKNINPDDVALPNDSLRILATYYATYRACVRNSEYQDSLFIEKARQYEKLYKDKEAQITAESLGIASPIVGTIGFKRG